MFVYVCWHFVAKKGQYLQKKNLDDDFTIDEEEESKSN
jgi:hypothetical protein